MNEQMFNEIFDSIKIIVNQEISNKLLPLSIEGKIVEKTKNKQYVIDYNNVKITAYPIATEYNIGDHVIVLLADGRINGKNKYILGKTDYRENIQQQLSKTLQEQIDDIKNDIQDISKDNQITPDEKISIAENWNGITSQFDMLVENMKKFNMDTTSIENLYRQYHDFVYSLILNDLNSVTKLTDEDRNQWNTLSQQYFNEFTTLSNEVNTLLNSVIYSINIVSDKSLQTKNETETFNLSYVLFKNGLETSKTSETLKWIIDSNNFSTEDNISYEYHKTDTPIDIKIELYNENGDLVAQDDKYITSFSDGIDGLQGPQGVPGKNGENGKTYYTHIAYADNENGDGFSQSPLDKDYIGIAVNEKESDNDTDISEYQWSLIRGAQGPQGIPGKNGNFTHFAYMNTPDNSDNSFTISVNTQDEVNNYIYLGQYTDKIESDSEDWQDYIWTKIKGEKGDKGEQGLQGIPGEQGIQGPKGDNGESSYTHIAYSNSSDGSVDFSTTVYQNKQYMGVLVDRNIQDSQNYQDYQWSKIKGEQGIKGDQGVPGKNGIDGRTTYFHTAFANSSDGSIDFSTTDYENKEYLGQYTDFTEADSTNYRDYQWTKIKGDSGKSILFTIDGDTIFEKTNDDSLVDTEPHIFTPNLIIGSEKITASSSNVFEWFLNDTPITTNNYGAQISLSKPQLNDGDKLKCKYKSNEVVVSLKVILSALEALNKAEEAHENALTNTETIAKFKDETGKEIVQIKADAKTLAATVESKSDKSEVAVLTSQISSKVSNEEYQSFKTQTAGQIASVISNQQNMWRDSSFEALKLSEYTNVADTWQTIFIATNGVKNTVSVKESQYGQEVPINNNTEKALRLNGRIDGNRDCYSNDYYSVSPGDVIEISYDFYKQGTGKAVVGVAWYDNSKQLIEWSQVYASTDNGGKWWHKEGKIVVPDTVKSKVPAMVRPYISFIKTGSESDFCYFDNVKIIKQASSQTFQSQTVDSLVGRVSNNENQLSETIQTVNSINTTVQNKAEKSEVSQLANQITQKVSNSDFETYKNQTAETISQAISSANGANNRLDTAEESIQQISKKTNDNTTLINQVKQTAQGIQTQVSSLSQSGVNLFPNGIFYDSKLTNYFYGVPSNDIFSVVPKSESDGGNYGSEKCLKIISTKARDVNLRANSFIPCRAGDTLAISFDYYNKDNTVDIIFMARFRYNNGTADSWISRVAAKVVVPDGQQYVAQWKQYSNEIKIPQNATSVQLMIGTSVSSQEGAISYVDNILVNSTEVSSSEFEQTNNKISMIIDDDGDGQSDSYFVLKDGTIEVGADYGFNIKANTTVDSNFELSANNIHGGVIYGNMPNKWYQYGTNIEYPYPIPDELKDPNSSLKSQLYIDGEDNNDFKLQLLDNHIYDTGKKAFIMRTELSPQRLLFQPISWNNDSLTGFGVSPNPGEIKAYANEISTVLQLTTDAGQTGLVIDGSKNAYQQGRQFVLVGKDGSDNNKSAIAASTVYTERIQSYDDGSPDIGITMDDFVNFTEDIKVGTRITSSQYGNSYMSFPDSYNVEFGAQNGGGSKLQIRLKSDGNTISGNTFNHSITMQGTGYILGLNSENNTEGIGKGQILAAKFITNSSKSLKTDIENIDLSDAIEDILSITPKSFLYKGEKEQYDEWIETGKSNDEAESFDRTVLNNKHIGFMAEDFALYDSLKPFITSVLDKNDNETVAGIDYGQLTPLLLAVCQKQQKEINSLNVQLSDLQEKFNDFLISMKG